MATKSIKAILLYSSKRNALKGATGAMMKFTIVSSGSRLRSVNSHLIRATLLNVSYGKRIKNLVDVGYFPKVDLVDFRVGLNDVACRTCHRIKLHVFSKCLTVVLLEELKRLRALQASTSWIHGDEYSRRSFPFLFNMLLITLKSW
ncbi:hypothetical protein CEUSTIGMA_g9803.t1 [Chlamydomonas eustigma]|uniref:Uncharacterized protein n=1 Tax=Chlamydomonas eustigma TaxID=1157962 RepID=A0A250XH19_9CHLO|nr:hypothetical protein CEUSTIGMA_g9803.t1 [Chlamydomonas eustigma]|eukprot:GAX82375.1 hypothetical protein CEUSTIGMA_g9803.t1 [Chlamydomonas eustigma]